MDDITTGASQDIKQATQMAKDMVTKYGMSSEIGLLSYDNDDQEVFIGRDFAHAKGYGEFMATKIDLEVKRIVDDCYAQASDIIRQNMDVLHRSTASAGKKKISGEEFAALFEAPQTTSEALKRTELVKNTEGFSGQENSSVYFL